MAQDFSINSLLKGSTDYNYLPSFTPGNTVSNSPFVARSADLYRQAGLLTDRQEAAYTGQAPGLTDADYADLASQHSALAQAHLQLGQDMKADSPATNIKAVSANGDAYGAHLEAARLCRTSIAGSPESADFQVDHRNMNSNRDRDPIHAPENISAKDPWLAAHRAFVMSRYAHNEVLFATANAPTLGGVANVQPVDYSPNQSTTAY